MYYVRGFAWAWMASRARNTSPSGFVTSNPQSTCHGPRPGPKLARGVWVGSLRATVPRARGKTRGRNRKNAEGPKEHIYIYVYRFHHGQLKSLFNNAPPQVIRTVINLANYSSHAKTSFTDVSSPGMQSRGFD